MKFSAKWFISGVAFCMSCLILINSIEQHADATVEDVPNDCAVYRFGDTTIITKSDNELDSLFISKGSQDFFTMSKTNTSDKVEFVSLICNDEPVLGASFDNSNEIQSCYVSNPETGAMLHIFRDEESMEWSNAMYFKSEDIQGYSEVIVDIDFNGTIDYKGFIDNNRNCFNPQILFEGRWIDVSSVDLDAWTANINENDKIEFYKLDSNLGWQKVLD